MGVSLAANSVLAKARAMYGHRLTAQNYNELLSCRTVSEVAAYLKAHTDYSSVFEGLTMGALHRRQIESLIQDRLFEQYASLCRYEKFIGDTFYEHFVMKSDVDLLLHAIRRIDRTHPDEFPRRMPEFFSRHSDIDVQALKSVDDIDSFMSTVEGSAYKAVLEPFTSRGKEGNPDFFGMELALNKFFYSSSADRIKRCYKGATKKELQQMLAFLVDLENIVSGYRIKRILDMPQAVFRNMMLPNGSMSEKQMERFLGADSAEAALKTLKGTPYEAFGLRNGASVEEVARKLGYDFCKSKIRFSSTPSIVMLCFVRLAENEVSNLTHIIEGIRYNIPSEEIRKILVGAGD